MEPQRVRSDATFGANAALRVTTQGVNLGVCHHVCDTVAT
jgi:hypothetical protein